MVQLGGVNDKITCVRGVSLVVVICWHEKNLGQAADPRLTHARGSVQTKSAGRITMMGCALVCHPAATWSLTAKGKPREGAPKQVGPRVGNGGLWL